MASATSLAQAAPRCVAVFGGSGFIGRSLVKALCGAGVERVRVVSRSFRPDVRNSLVALGRYDASTGAQQVECVEIGSLGADTAASALEGADAAVNLVAILREDAKKKQTFQNSIIAPASLIAEAAKAAGIKNMVHVSAIGADSSGAAAYSRAKGDAEGAVRSAVPSATIVRPSVVFGAEDQFFNRFSTLVGLFPVIPLFGGGEALFQPVYVHDVATGIVNCLGNDKAQSATFEFGGPDVVSLREVFERVIEYRGLKGRRFLAPVPLRASEILAKTVLKRMPEPLCLTPDQLQLLQQDNVVSTGALTLRDLGVTPSSIAERVPKYIR